MRSARWLAAFAAVAALSASACGLIVGLKDRQLADGQQDDGAVDGGPGADTGLSEAGACDASVNPVGCACAPVGTPNACFQGLTGPKSACMTPGTQTCGMDKKWGACTGGDLPKPEVCLDDVDNDCNGKVDEQCKCTDDVDLCNLVDGGTLNPQLYNMFWDPPQAKANVPLDIYVVTKQQPFGAPRSICFPNCAVNCNGGSDPCSSPGKNCGGWLFARFRRTLPAGTHSFEFTYMNQAGCGTGTQAIPTPSTIMVQ